MSAADTVLLLGKHPVKISLEGHRGAVVICLRRQYLAAGGALKPTFQGINFPADCLPEVIAALERLKAQMIGDGALGGGCPPKFHSNVYPRDF
ncbi:MAG: hypothetical protein P4L96_07520 [Rhodoferax sp.]|nr:hypothetical protein [Rhodoferax sp.]